MKPQCFADTVPPGNLWRLSDQELIVLAGGRNSRKARLAMLEIEQRERMKPHDIDADDSPSYAQRLIAEEIARLTRERRRRNLIAALVLLAGFFALLIGLVLIAHETRH